jgi:hypothetical protein
MCRSIVTLRGPEPASSEAAHAAALQFVRKVSGYRKPSRANEEVFNHAVDEIAHAVEHLLADLVTVGGAGPRSDAPARS